MTLGIYISVPFCRTKCSYCNFASGVFSRAIFERYVDRVCADMISARANAAALGGKLEIKVDSVYLGGGTPTLLDIEQLRRLFVTISQNFEVAPNAEITVECAPGTLTPALIETFGHCGVDRVSLGVQSFVDEEARAVGRLHNRQTVLDDIARLKAAGINNINVDLIAGLPHQNLQSWRTSLAEAVAVGVPHVSVYMLEVDSDSRLGREVIAGGTKYHAHFVPDEDLTADLYELAREDLEKAGIAQYEISNSAKQGFESRHNLKYWQRHPYLGFGVDAHSMLEATEPRNADPSLGESASPVTSLRFATADSLEQYISGTPLQVIRVSREEALQEALFLGLRLNRGVNLKQIVEEFGNEAVSAHLPAIQELTELNLLRQDREIIRLTARGRLLSNDVFARFLTSETAAEGIPS